MGYTQWCMTVGKATRLLVFAIGLSLFPALGCACNRRAANHATSPGPRPSSLTMPSKITMAFVPSVESQKITESGTPLAKLLEAEMGIPVVVQNLPDYTVVVEGTGAGKIDVAWIPPLAYVLGKQRFAGLQGILMVTRFGGQKSYRGQILVKKGVAKTLADLKGKRFAFADSASTSGFLFPRLLFLKNGIDLDKDFKSVVSAGGHDKVIYAILQGSVDAGATFDDARRLAVKRIPNVYDKTEVIAYTDWIPNDNVTVRPNMDTALRDKIKSSLLKIAATDEGRKLLFNLYEIDGLTEFDEAAYDPVREAAEKLHILKIPAR
ncbi:MAG: phosphate/phosphite/phosphonate ABC transporter substrate-binding protein [bacterium]